MCHIINRSSAAVAAIDSVERESRLNQPTNQPTIPTVLFEIEKFLNGSLQLEELVGRFDMSKGGRRWGG